MAGTSQEVIPPRPEKSHGTLGWQIWLVVMSTFFSWLLQLVIGVAREERDPGTSTVGGFYHLPLET